MSEETVTFKKVILFCLHCKCHTLHALTKSGKSWMCGCGTEIPVLEVKHEENC